MVLYVFCFVIVLIFTICLYFKDTKEKVKLLIQLADSLVEKGHAHSASIKSWVAAVDKRYKDFASRMEKYRIRLESKLGLQSEVKRIKLVAVLGEIFTG